MLQCVVLVGVVIPCVTFNQNDSVLHIMEAALNQLEYISDHAHPSFSSILISQRVDPPDLMVSWNRHLGTHLIMNDLHPSFSVPFTSPE
jgi:hypothetical protein